MALAMLGMAAAHGHMESPAAPQGILGIAWQDHWYSQGSMIGCPRATGENCNNEKPCCAQPMEPTLIDPSQLTYLKLGGNGSKIIGATNFFITPPAYSDTDATKNPFKLRGAAYNSQPGEKTNTKTGGGKAAEAAAAASLVEAYLAAAEAKISAGDVAASPYKMNPWMAPGHAPVANPCGVLGGWRYPRAIDYVSGPGNAHEKDRAGLGGHTNNEMPHKGMFPPVGTAGDAVLLTEQNIRMQDMEGNEDASNSDSDRKINSNSNSDRDSYSKSSMNSMSSMRSKSSSNNWAAGGTVEVSYSLVANHGGGVQYRLCPLSELIGSGGGNSDGSGRLDEACFQRMPLDFVGNTSWFQVGLGTRATRTPFAPVRVTDATTAAGGVNPPGSTWTKVGLPACAGATGGNGETGECAAPQFENAVSAAGYWGYGNPSAQSSAAFRPVLDEVHTDGDHYGSADYSIVDLVRVPEGLRGEFVLSWRWDSETTAQVWTQCAVVSIE